MGGIHQGVLRGLAAHLDAGEPILAASYESPEHGGAGTEVEQEIISVLDTQIRPAVARDGGDIVFQRFEDGVVYLQMKGACHGCPSAMLTLKQGIESRLRQAIPAVLEVRAV